MKEVNLRENTSFFALFIRKRISFYIIATIIIIAAMEIALRQYGFLQAPLYRDDKNSCYVQVENQNLNRFGKKFMTNEYSMRSLPLKKNETRVLVLGDSVVNGGVQTDHNMLATTLLENQFTKEFSTSIRVLNASAGGWGVDNCMGVVKTNGDFDCKIMSIVLSSHDATGSIGTKKIAGVDKYFQSKQYPFALAELFDRYLIPKIEYKFGINSGESTNNTEGTEYSEGWKFLYNYCKEKNIPLIIYLHAEKEEHDKGEYNDNGKWIINFAKENKIELIQDLNTVSDKDYRDTIHFTEEGQKVIKKLLYPSLKEKLIKLNL